MRPIDADALVAKINLTIALLKRTMKNFGIENDPECQMELKTYQDIRDGIKEEPTVESKREWISVKDRLPDKDGKYLVASLWNLDGKYHVETARYAKNLSDVWMDWKSGSGWWNGDSESDWEETDVKYWMPLPEPPKEG